MRDHTLRTFGIILLIHMYIRQMEKCKNCWFHIIAKPALEFGCNSLFCTNLDNGLKEIARLTIQCQNPDIKRFCNLSTKFCES